MLRETRRYFKALLFENKFFSDLDIINDRDEYRKILFFRSCITKGDRVIDIGANVGFFTTIFAHLVGSQGQVEAFEANPYVYKILKKRTKRKKQITTYPLAISYTSGKTLPLYIRPFSLFYCGTLETSMITKEGFGKKEVRVNVQTLSLDDALKKGPPPSMIKIDVEGHEDEIFRGASHLLTHLRPLIVFEYVQRPNFVASSPEMIAEYGYRCLDNKTLKPFVRPADSEYITDILAIPEEKFFQIDKKLEAIALLT